MARAKTESHTHSNQYTHALTKANPCDMRTNLHGISATSKTKSYKRQIKTK